MPEPRPPHTPVEISGQRVRRRRRRKHRDRSQWFVWFVVVFGLLSASALVIYGVTRSASPDATWLKLATGLKKRGEPIHVIDIKPTEVPAEKDFFAAPLFEGVAAGSPKNDLLPHAVAPVGGVPVGALLASATQGGGVNLDVIAVAMQKAGLIETKTEFLLPGDKVRSGMRALGLDFAPLTEAAARPDAALPADVTKPFPSQPHLPYIEALGNWLAIGAVAELSTNNATAAADDLHLIARLADSLATAPSLAAQRLRRQLMGLFAGGVRAGIDAGAWTEKQLANFSETLSQSDLIAGFALGLRGERAQLNTYIDDTIADRKPGPSPSAEAWLGPDLAKPNTSALRESQVAINTSIQRFLDVLSNRVLVPANLTPTEEKPEPPAPVEDRLSALVDDARAFAQVQTYVAQTATACALDRYHLTAGLYPELLTSLEPEWISELPRNPLSAQPFDYKKTDAGFTLTSAGWPGGTPWTWTRSR